jgi:hypothetical protein
MTITLFLYALLVWCIIAVFAVMNGIARETLLLPALGKNAALPVSGLILSAIVFTVTYFSIGMLRSGTAAGYLLIGVQWVAMTLLFEFLFGHYVAGKPWSELLQAFNPRNGDLFTLVLLISLFSPILAATLKGLL